MENRLWSEHREYCWVPVMTKVNVPIRTMGRHELLQVVSALAHRVSLSHRKGNNFELAKGRDIFHFLITLCITAN
jgi:hypothetical protein